MLFAYNISFSVDNFAVDGYSFSNAGITHENSVTICEVAETIDLSGENTIQGLAKKGEPCANMDIYKCVILCLARDAAADTDCNSAAYYNAKNSDQSYPRGWCILTTQYINNNEALIIGARSETCSAQGGKKATTDKGTEYCIEQVKGHLSAANGIGALTESSGAKWIDMRFFASFETEWKVQSKL